MRHVKNQSGNTVVVGIIAVVVVAGAGLGGWYLYRHNHKKTTATSASTSTQTSQAVPPTMSAGTDNASLDSDVNNISGSMNQENSDAQAAGKALNDQQNEVVVPTE